MTENEDWYDDYYHDEYDREVDPECWNCMDSGRIVAADGYHEYLGYSYLPCPHCTAGVGLVGDGPNNPFWE